jgi:hypothetical protein
VKTNTASDVASLASGFGSWIQKPRAPVVSIAVTMPVVMMCWPLNGEVWAAPWMSGMATLKSSLVIVPTAVVPEQTAVPSVSDQVRKQQKVIVSLGSVRVAVAP